MFIPDELKDILVSTADTLGGSLRFRNTRMPVKVVVDNLYGGSSIDDIVEAYGGMNRDDLLVFVRWQQETSERILELCEGTDARSA